METIVMSVGGSLIVPHEIDTNFLTNLKNFITEETSNNNRRFIIIAGGGKTYRLYRDALKQIAVVEPKELDELGITACALNAHLLRLMFRGLEDKVLVNPDKEFFEPGASSDRVAVRSASKYQAQKIVNLSNIDYVYTDNPKTNLEAEKITTISWSDFKKLIPEEWNPGLSSPFDPVAAREAEAKNIEVAAINGDRLDELKKYLNGEEFVGTRIHK